MDKQKGFTLIELLAVMVVIAILLLVAVPKVSGVIEQTKIDSYNNEVGIIQGVARQYVTSNAESLCNTDITLETLYDANYLDEPVMDPRTGMELSIDSFVRVSCNSDEYVFSFYNLDDDTTIPTISLLGSNPVYLEKGVNTYVEEEATAYDEAEGDLSALIVISGEVDESVAGDYLKMYSVSDSSGNATTVVRTIHVVDTIVPEAPSITISDSNLTNSDVIVSITPTGDAIRSEYMIDSSSWLEYIGPITINNNATVTARSYDPSDNSSIEASLVISNIDKDAPTVTFSPDGSVLINNSIDVDIVVSDDVSGLDSYTYETSSDNGSNWSSISSNLNSDITITLSDTGLNLIRVSAVDTLGNSVEEYSNIFAIDIDIPDTPSLLASITNPTNSDVVISFIYPTDSVTNEYKIGTGSWTSYSGAVTLVDNSVVYARSFDSAGNESLTAEINVENIDKTAPNYVSSSITSCTYQDGNTCWIKSGTEMTFKLRGNDAGLGIATTNIEYTGSGDDSQASHNWNSNATSFTILDNSTKAIFTGVDETYESNGTYEVEWTINGGANMNSKTINYYFEDETGNSIGYTDTGYKIGVDNGLPSVSIATNGNSTASNSHSTIVTASDVYSGLSTLQYAWSTSTTTPTNGWINFSSGATLTKNTSTGNYYLHIKAVDNLDNTTNLRSSVFVFDNTIPSGVFTSYLTSPHEGDYITFNPSDSGAAGVDYWQYRISSNGSAYTSWSTNINGDTNGNITLDTVGTNTIQARVYDNAGNTNTKSVTYTVRELDSLIAVGSRFSVIVKDDGEAWSWGYNNHAQLGIGIYGNEVLSPTIVTDYSDFKNINNGHHANVAISNTGRAYIWGWNLSDMLYDDNSIDDDEPTYVSEIGTNAKMGDMGVGHTLIVTNSGNIWAMGSNNSGQIGNGSSSDVGQIIQLSTISGVDMVAAAMESSLALKTNGTVYSWGSNSEGQLGLGNLTDRSTPKQISGLSNIKYIDMGEGTGYAVTNSGQLYAWGRNDFGQLGNGSTATSTTPVLVTGINNVKMVAGGCDYTIAVKTDGTLWAWGESSSLGINSTIPVQVTGITDVKQAETGPRANEEKHVLILKYDGSIQSYGSNNDGQLGTGTENSSLIPVNPLGNLNLY